MTAAAARSTTSSSMNTGAPPASAPAASTSINRIQPPCVTRDEESRRAYSRSASLLAGAIVHGKLDG
jgi:hypothetical protein